VRASPGRTVRFVEAWARTTSPLSLVERARVKVTVRLETIERYWREHSSSPVRGTSRRCAALELRGTASYQRDFVDAFGYPSRPLLTRALERLLRAEHRAMAQRLGGDRNTIWDALQHAIEW